MSSLDASSSICHVSILLHEDALRKSRPSLKAKHYLGITPFLTSSPVDQQALLSMPAGGLLVSQCQECGKFTCGGTITGRVSTASVVLDNSCCVTPALLVDGG
jgi:hypothetical protein